MLAAPLNWFAGWAMILAGFIAGALIGLGFHREGFLGGYTSVRRRMLRLGHIALVALGGLNLVYSYAPSSHAGGATAASILFVVGGIAMPLVCFLTACRERWRRAFPIPVIVLVAAVVLVLVGGIP